jgi:predicted O-methyltransferase YrrM/glycosyltransferase involved in cell wall biosynthesis
MQLSVIICTHNPREDYLRRVLDALKAQTLPKEQWELLLIDNASKEPLANFWDLSWHPHARHIREEELGLTPARLRGIKESTGELLVFVDDDNILDENFIALCLKISAKHPRLGTWGGQLEPEYQGKLELPEKMYWNILAIRRVTADQIADDIGDYKSLPWGAGLCVRRDVAERYVIEVRANKVLRELDRKGAALGGWGDVMMVVVALKMGYTMGVLEELHLIHIIPAHRLTNAYILKLAEESDESKVLFDYYVLGKKSQPSNWRGEIGFFLHDLRKSSFERKISQANRRGSAKGMAKLKQMDTCKTFIQKNQSNRIYANLQPRLRLLRNALTRRYVWSDIMAMARENGIEYRDVVGDVEPLGFARAIFENEAAQIPPPPEFSKKLGSASSFTPAGAPDFYNSEPSVGRFLGQLVFYKKPAVVVELGCFVGWTSAHLAMAIHANATGKLYCVDCEQNYLDVTLANLKRLGLDKAAALLLGTSMDTKVVSALPNKIDVLFIDTSHRYPDTLDEILFYAPRMAEGGYMVLHDSVSWAGVRRSIAEVAGRFRVLTFVTEKGNGVSVLVKATSQAG